MGLGEMNSNSCGLILLVGCQSAWLVSLFVSNPPCWAFGALNLPTIFGTSSMQRWIMKLSMDLLNSSRKVFNPDLVRGEWYMIGTQYGGSEFGSMSTSFPPS